MDHGISDGGPLIIYCERKEDESLGDRPAKTVTDAKCNDLFRG